MLCNGARAHVCFCRINPVVCLVKISSCPFSGVAKRWPVFVVANIEPNSNRFYPQTTTPFDSFNYRLSRNPDALPWMASEWFVFTELGIDWQSDCFRGADKQSYLIHKVALLDSRRPPAPLHRWHHTSSAHFYRRAAGNNFTTLNTNIPYRKQQKSETSFNLS